MQSAQSPTVRQTDTVGGASGPSELLREVEGGGHPPPPPSIEDLPPPSVEIEENPKVPAQQDRMPASPLIPPPPPSYGEAPREGLASAKSPSSCPAVHPHGTNGSSRQSPVSVQDPEDPNVSPSLPSNPNPDPAPKQNPNPNPAPSTNPNPNPNPGQQRPTSGVPHQPYQTQVPPPASPSRGPSPCTPPRQQNPLQVPPLRHGLPIRPHLGPPTVQPPRHGAPMVHAPHHVPAIGLVPHHRPTMIQPPPPQPLGRTPHYVEPAAVRPPRFQEPVVRQPSYQLPRSAGSPYRGETQIHYLEEQPPQYHEEAQYYPEEGLSLSGDVLYHEESGSLSEDSPPSQQARHPRRQAGTLRISKWVNPIPADPDDGQQQSGEQELATKMLQIQSKRFYIDVKQNRRGRFMKVAEIGADGRRNQVFLALSTAAEFRDHLSHFSDFYANLGPPNPDTLPEDGKLKSETMVKDNRRYYLDLKENSRGRFLRVSQTIARGGPRCQIAIPAQGMIEFRDALQELLDEFGTDDGGYKGELPEGRHMRVENKNFYFDIGQNNRGIYMRISEVKTNFRTAITIPEKSWSRFRDIFADYVDKMKDGGEKGPSESNK